MITNERSLVMARTPGSVRALFILMVLSVLVLSCDDDDDDNNEMRPRENIVALAQSNDNLSSLEAILLRFPDLVTTLSGTGEYTVFAPTNQAFSDMLDAVGQSSLDDVPDDVLREVLEYHVISGSALNSGELSTGALKTVNGEDIQVVVNSMVTLNGSSDVTTADVNASNGVVHVVDAVLLPPSITPIVGTVVAPAYFNKNFTTLIAAVKAASPIVLETLLNADAKTLFAPTNEAFEAAGITSLPEQSVLDAVLTYHVVGMEVASADIADGSSVAPSLNGNLYLSKTSDGVFINGTSQVTTADIEASNGVVHVIDRTLIPPSQTIADIAVDYASSATPEFTQLVAALARTQGQGDDDLLAAAGSDGDLTVFAPTDAAFEELYSALGVAGVDDIPLNTLIAVLKHHIVPARVFSTDLTSGAVGTLNGSVTIDLTANPPSVTGNSGPDNKAALQTSLLNIHATNGVIHVIDKVLLP